MSTTYKLKLKESVYLGGYKEAGEIVEVSLDVKRSLLLRNAAVEVAFVEQEATSTQAKKKK